MLSSTSSYPPDLAVLPRRLKAMLANLPHFKNPRENAFGAVIFGIALVDKR